MRRGDLIAGLSVAGLLLPEAVAYAGIAGLPPQRAILATVAGCIAYWIVGRSRFAIISPTSSSAAILAATLAALPGDAELKATAATAVVVLVAAFFLLAALARLGGLTGFISRPVLRGFAFGLAVTIIIGQLPTLVGAPDRTRGIFHQIELMVRDMPNWNTASIAIGVSALICLFFLKRFPAIPGAFLVLAAGVAASILLRLPERGVATVGAIGILPSLPDWQSFARLDYALLVQLALPLVLIVFAESWGTIRAMALRHGEKVDANRELAALALANGAAAAVQGMPAGAGFSAGAASEAAGAATRMTGPLAGIGLAILIAAGGTLVGELPEPVVAAVVIASLAGSLNPAPLLRLWRLGRDQYVALGAALAVLFLGVLNGMLVAIALSIAALIQRLATPHVARLGRLGRSHDYVDMARHSDAAAPHGIAIWRPAQSLFFANAERIFGTILSGSRVAPAPRAVVVSLEESFDLDSTAFDALIEFDGAMRAAGLHVQYARVHDRVRDLLATSAGDITGRCSFSVDDAVSAVEASLSRRRQP